MSSEVSSPVADTLVRAQLERVLASAVFARSERLSSFLRFIVEHSLQGETASLKEQALACELYGKGTDFSSAADPIVRVDARRLRDRLREYYAEFYRDPLLIEVPKGSYVPAFRRNPAADAPALVEPRASAGSTSFRHLGIVLSGAIAGLLLVAACVAAVRLRPPPDQTPGWPGNTVARQLMQPGDVRIGVLSPDGRHIAIIPGGPNGRALQIRDAESSDGRVILPPTTENFMGVTFSPDGSELYFVSRGAEESSGKLFRVHLSGGERLRVKNRVDSRISFSPDGRRFAFVREDSNRRESVLMLANRDGSAEHRLLISRLPEYLNHPAWSPDGNTIACTLVRPTSRETNLLLVDPGQRTAEIR
jgi:hypothetical protein